MITNSIADGEVGAKMQDEQKETLASKPRVAHYSLCSPCSVMLAYGPSLK